jgi:hypothetical protein
MWLSVYQFTFICLGAQRCFCLPVQGPVQGHVQVAVRGPVLEPVREPIQGPVRGPAQGPIQVPVHVTFQVPVPGPVCNNYILFVLDQRRRSKYERCTVITTEINVNFILIMHTLVDIKIYFPVSYRVQEG